MYSESDLEAAVTAGALTPQQAASFRDYVASSRQMPMVDEEHFRLLTGFNDIFVSIAAVILLVAVGWIGYYVAARISTATDRRPFMGLFVAGDRLGPRRILHPPAAHGAAQHPAAAGLRRRRLRDRRCSPWCSAIGERPVREQRAARRPGHLRPPRRSRPARPGSTGAGSRCRSRSRPASRRWSALVLGLIASASSAGHDRRAGRAMQSCWSRRWCSASACSCSRCAGTDPIRSARRGAPTSPSGCICWRRR